MLPGETGGWGATALLNPQGWIYNPSEVSRVSVQGPQMASDFQEFVDTGIV